MLAFADCRQLLSIDHNQDEPFENEWVPPPPPLLGAASPIDFDFAAYLNMDADAPPPIYTAEDAIAPIAGDPVAGNVAGNQPPPLLPPIQNAAPVTAGSLATAVAAIVPTAATPTASERPPLGGKQVVASRSSVNEPCSQPTRRSDRIGTAMIARATASTAGGEELPANQAGAQPVKHKRQESASKAGPAKASRTNKKRTANGGGSTLELSPPTDRYRTGPQERRQRAEHAALAIAESGSGENAGSRGTSLEGDQTSARYASQACRSGEC